MSDYPGAAPPPPDVTPDLENPEDVLWTINLVTQALTLFAVTVFVGLRFYTKSAVLRATSWSPDDCKKDDRLLLV